MAGAAPKTPHIFLCHSSSDKRFVDRLAQDLWQLCVYAWYDGWALAPGDSLHDEIGTALEHSALIGVVMSPDSINSRWCNKELNQALSREVRTGRAVIVPLRYRRVSIPAFLEDRRYLDFSRTYFTALARLAVHVHELSQRCLEGELLRSKPKNLAQVRELLVKLGWEDYTMIDHDDCERLRKLFKRYNIDLPQGRFEIESYYDGRKEGPSFA